MSIITDLYQTFLRHPSISTDTRTIREGDIFFALSGPNFNANEFAHEALKKGAVKCVIDDEAYAKSEDYVVVEDTLKALQDLARHHRSQLKIPIIGLTGSNGKTTTKELIKAVLLQKYKVLATSGNLNNHIGVPLTILSISPDHEIAIIEMGANHIGEIALLCDIANPTHGLITNIGKAHIEGFGGFEGVIRGKSELYQHLISHEGTVWINSGNEILSNMAKRFRNPLFYPAKEDYYHCRLTETVPTLQVVPEDGGHITTQLIGAYNFDNLAAALCIGKYFGVRPELANSAIAAYSPSNNRSQLIKTGSNTVILDAYNANPSSMAAALDNLALMEAPKKAVILGDMKELGPESDREHEALGRKLAEANLQQIYLCGELIKPALKHLPNAIYVGDTDTLKRQLAKTQFEDYLILIKASRSIGLEQVVNDI